MPKKIRKNRNRKSFIVLSTVTFSLLLMIGFLIYFILNIQNNQAIYENLNKRVLALTYKDIYLQKDVTATKISDLSADLVKNQSKMAAENFTKLSTDLKTISVKFDSLTNVNSLFSSAVILQDKLTTTVAIKDNLTEDNVKAVDLTKLSNNQFKSNLTEALKAADDQLAQIAKIKTDLSNNTATSTISDEIGKILNANLKTAYMTQLSARDAAAVKAKYAGKKIIALTFDDGPNPMTTPGLLDILKQNNVKVTFCSLGQNIQANPDIVKREAAEGHEIISHSWSHPDLTKLSKDDVISQVENTSLLIKQLTGQDTPLYRPPYGNTNDAVLSDINRGAMKWDIDTEDWQNSTSDPVVKAAVSAAHDQAVVLMHDIHAWSVAAVPEIIKQLKAQGYTFVTASELVQVKYGAIAGHQVYY